MVGKIVDRESLTFLGGNNDLKILSQMNDMIEKNDLKKWCVKCKLEDGSYVVSSAKNYDVWNAIAMLKE